MRDLALAVIGSVAFVLITVFEQLPVLGWLGWALSAAAWIVLGRAASGAIAAAVIGGVTGFVGALTSWMAQTGNLFGFTTAPGDRFGALFGFIGSSLGIAYWPLVGIVVCGAAALLAVRGPREA